MLSFLPPEKSALDRSPALSKWVEVWASTLGRELEVLEIDGWFEHGHGHCRVEMNVDVVFIAMFKTGTFVWSHAPAVPIMMIEDLRQAR